MATTEKETQQAATMLRRLSLSWEKSRIARVEVDYDGCEGVGLIQSIRCFDRHGACIAVDALAGKNRSTTDGSATAEEVLLRELIGVLLPNGWNQYEGAYGSLTVDVRNRRAHLDHHERVLDLVDSDQDFSF